MAKQDQKSEFVLLDYNGTAGSYPGPGGKKIKHTMSPLIAAKPVAGAMSLALQPGFNRIAAKTWAQYTDFPGIPERVKSREIKTLGDVLEMDESTLTAMIERSYCHASLTWLRAELTTASTLDQQDRSAMISAIDAQMQKGSVPIQSTPYIRPMVPVIQPVAVAHA
jgi:hypothetical protein